MTIRPANESDIAELAQIIARSVNTLNAADDSPEDLAFIRSKLDEHNLRRHLQTREVFVLEFDSRLIGIVALESDRLHTLFVEPTKAKMGHGRTLVSHIESVARERTGIIAGLASRQAARITGGRNQ